MLNVPKLGRWPLDQRESLVDVVVHISNSFQNGIQPELLAVAAFVSILTREFLPCQRASMMSSVVDLGAHKECKKDARWDHFVPSAELYAF